MKNLLIFIFVIFLLIFTWKQYRHFYYVDDMTFTIWKTHEGCYLMPYRYWGLSAPKKDYIKASNVGYVYIYIDSRSNFVVFNDYTYIGGLNTVECHFENYDYHQFVTSADFTIEELESWEIKRNEYKKRLPFLEVDIRWMNVDIQNSSDLKDKK